MTSCKDCIHCEVCREYVASLAQIKSAKFKTLEEFIDCDDCDHFKKHSDIIELPLEVGNRVWVTLYAKKFHKTSLEPLEYEVYAISVFCMEYYNNIIIVIRRGEHKISFQIGAFKSCLGKTIFFSKEEAEQALKERNNAT